MEREQFTFYQSFAKAVSRIKSKAARCDAYDVIVNYALYGIEPDLDKISDSAAMAFDLIKPNLDASRRKAESGKRGGKAEANGKQNESKPQANVKQTASKKEKEKENKKEDKKEKEKENECYPTREEVRAYAESRKSPVDPDRFYDYFTADPKKMWVDSKGQPVKNWKQKFITWEGRETDAGRGNPRGAEDSTTAGAEKWGNLYS